MDEIEKARDEVVKLEGEEKKARKEEKKVGKSRIPILKIRNFGEKKLRKRKKIFRRGSRVYGFLKPHFKCSLHNEFHLLCLAPYRSHHF